MGGKMNEQTKPWESKLRQKDCGSGRFEAYQPLAPGKRTDSRLVLDDKLIN